MKRLFMFSSLAFLVLAGCSGNAGSRRGGGDGGESFTFSRGYVFVRSADRNVYIADGSDYTQIRKLTTSGGNKHPSLSPDGRQVVYVHTAPGPSDPHDDAQSHTEIHIVSSDGSNDSTLLYSLSDLFGNFRTPVFSPDETKIAYGFTRMGAEAIGFIGSSLQLFRPLRWYFSPSFATFDNNSVWMVDRSIERTTVDIVRFDLTSYQFTPVASGLDLAWRTVDDRVVISPDGKKAGFVNGASRLSVVDLSTQSITELTSYPSDPSAIDSLPTWVGNSQIGFTSNVGGPEAIYQVATDGTGRPNRVIPNAIEGWYGPN